MKKTLPPEITATVGALDALPADSCWGAPNPPARADESCFTFADASRSAYTPGASSAASDDAAAACVRVPLPATTCGASRAQPCGG